jgi:hypothetical protein
LLSLDRVFTLRETWLPTEYYAGALVDTIFVETIVASVAAVKLIDPYLSDYTALLIRLFYSFEIDRSLSLDRDVLITGLGYPPD